MTIGAQSRAFRLGQAIAIAVTTVAVAAAMTAPADAKGCLKGAVVGGIAGHYAGHHGLLGAAAGCLIGRHESKQKDHRDQNNRDIRGNAPQ
jgi:hypothetical protein